MSVIDDPIYKGGALSTAINALDRKFDQNGKDFLSLPLNWQQFLSAIVVRKRGVTKKGTTIFAKEFAEIITPEKEARISDLLSYINESIVVVRTDSSVAAVGVEGNKMQYILTDHIIDIDIDSAGNRKSNTHSLPRTFVYDLIATI